MPGQPQSSRPIKSLPPVSPQNQWIGYGLVLLSGSFWACLGLFFRALEHHNLAPELIAFDRTLVAGLTLLIFWGLREPGVLLIKRRDLGYFGLYSSCLAGFFLTYIYAVKAGSVALAAVLLYSGPLWVVLFARLRWGEALTPLKLMALALALIGCGLVAAGGAELQGGMLAIGLGLAAGFGYALYSLLSNEGLQRGYGPATIVTYAMLGAAVCLAPFQSWRVIGLALQTPTTWPALLGVALISTVLAPLCYAAGQQRIGASTASILATIEPVVAAGLAWISLDEHLTAWQLAGSACVLAAVLCLASATKPPDPPAASEGRADQRSNP